MSQGKPRDLRKEQQWRRWIGQWQSSGLSIRAFCEQHHLSQGSFYAWRRVLQQRDAAAGAFVPVQIVSEEPLPGCTYEVVLAGGLTLRAGRVGHACGARILAMVRPERIRIAATDEPAGDNTLNARIREATYLGQDLHLNLRLDGGQELSVVTQGRAAPRLVPGEEVVLTVDAADISLLPK